MTNKTLRILVVDDHAIVRKGIVMVLRLAADFDVVGEASDGEGAISAVRNLRPDLVLLDRVMPGMDVLETIQGLRQQAPHIRILILTGTDLDAKVVDILSAGVDGYVLKETSPDALKQAIRIVAQGEAYLDPAVTRHLLSNLTSKPRTAPTSPLTKRETEVLKLMTTQATYREIAVQLSISEETVRSHAKHILAKLEQPNRAQAVLAAARLGLIDLTDLNSG